MNEGSVSLRAAYHGCRNSDDELWRDQYLKYYYYPAKVRYWIREIKRSPDTMKAAAILVVELIPSNHVYCPRVLNGDE